MAAYCAVPPDDPFAASKAMFAALAAELAGPAAAGLTACELEDLLDESGREVIRQLLQDHYDLRSNTGRAAGPGGPGSRGGSRRDRPDPAGDRARPAPVHPVRHGDGDPVRLAGAGSAQLAPGRRRPVPSSRAGTRTPWRSWPRSRPPAARSRAAHAAIARRCGNVIGKRQLEQAVVSAAADIPAFYAARVPEPCTPETLVVMSADCKGIVMRPGALRAATAKAAARLGKMRTRLSAGEKPNRKRMACLVTVYDAEPAERRPHDVIAPPGGRNGTRKPRPGPKALAKWLAGSVRKDPAEVIAAAFDEAEARDPQHLRTWVVLVDGAEHQLGLVRAEAARRGAEIHIIIDIIHVLEYLWGAAWSLHDAGDPAAEDWVAVKALAVLAGDSTRAAQEITAEADAAGLEGSRRNGADACVRYLGNKHEFLRYDQALAAGWPIATGVIEGACRHLIADRLDIGGARWGLDGAEAVLTLRAVIANGDFEEYWRFHLEREQQRLYPGVKQGQYTLGA